MRGLGSGIKEFKDASKDDGKTIPTNLKGKKITPIYFAKPEALVSGFFLWFLLNPPSKLCRFYKNSSSNGDPVLIEGAYVKPSMMRKLMGLSRMHVVHKATAM